MAYDDEAADFAANGEPVSVSQTHKVGQNDRMDRAKRYEIVRPLGSGGMGNVVLAFDKDRQIHVALKSLKPELYREKDLHRFKREFLIAKEINDISIVRVFDANFESDAPYFTMEYCERGDLRRVLPQTRGNDELVWDYVLKIARGLDVLHTNRPTIIHRDLKPGNILIGDDGHPKISDFGLSRRIDDTTITNSNWGTRGFTAPEQLEEMHQVDRRADMYSLGAIAYYLSTGEVPGHGMTRVSCLIKSPNLNVIVLALLGMRPDKRISSVSNLLKAKSRIDEIFQNPHASILGFIDCHDCGALAAYYQVDEGRGRVLPRWRCLDCWGRRDDD